MSDYDVRVQINRNSKKKSGYEVELRDDGFYYVKSVPSKKSSIKPGDRILEINGVKHTDFSSETKAKKLIDTLVLDVKDEAEESSGSEEESEESSGSEESEESD